MMESSASGDVLRIGAQLARQDAARRVDLEARRPRRDARPIVTFAPLYRGPPRVVYRGELTGSPKLPTHDLNQGNTGIRARPPLPASEVPVATGRLLPLPTARVRFGKPGPTALASLWRFQTRNGWHGICLIRYAQRENRGGSVRAPFVQLEARCVDTEPSARCASVH
jgi:hypothetical protein